MVYLGVIFYSVLRGGCCQPCYVIQVLSVGYPGSSVSITSFVTERLDAHHVGYAREIHIGGDLGEQSIYYC